MYSKQIGPQQILKGDTMAELSSAHREFQTEGTVYTPFMVHSAIMGGDETYRVLRLSWQEENNGTAAYFLHMPKQLDQPEDGSSRLSPDVSLRANNNAGLVELFSIKFGENYQQWTEMKNVPAPELHTF